MGKPKFKDGKSIIVDYAKRKLELPEYAWNHIIKEGKRDYFEQFFDKNRTNTTKTLDSEKRPQNGERRNL